MAVALAGIAWLADAAPAAAATGAQVPLVSAGILGDIFSSIGHAVLGAFSWTIGLASRFILTTVGALVRMLIPRSWAGEGVRIMEWIVAVPDYAGTVTSPAGRTVYGFGGINALRDLMTWIGVALLPLTLLYGTTRAMIGERGHAAAPIARVLAVAALLVSYPYWWSQAAALTDTVTHMILALPQVASGLHQLMLYAVDGVALGGWQLVDLALMALVAFELLSLIFLKVALVLFGALLYAAGPITIGLVGMESGAALARAWASAALVLIALPVAWALLFAVGALLVGDAGTAGPLLAGNSSVGSLLGGVLLAGAGAASLWMCLRAAREAMGLLRAQLGGLLAAGHRGGSRSVPVAASHGSSPGSLRHFGARVAQAASGATGELAAAGAGGAALMTGGRAVAHLARRGALGTAALGARRAAGVAVPYAAGVVGRSRAGAVAVRMAKGGTAGWHAARTADAGAQPKSASGTAAPAPRPADRSNGRSARSPVIGASDAGTHPAGIAPPASPAVQDGHSKTAPSPAPAGARVPPAMPVPRPGAATPRNGDPRPSRATAPRTAPAPRQSSVPPSRGKRTPGRRGRR